MQIDTHSLFDQTAVLEAIRIGERTNQGSLAVLAILVAVFRLGRGGGRCWAVVAAARVSGVWLARLRWSLALLGCSLFLSRREGFQ